MKNKIVTMTSELVWPLALPSDVTAAVVGSEVSKI